MKKIKISVKAYPNSKKYKIIKIKENRFDIYTKAPALKNLANKSIIYMLSKEFGIPEKNIKIISGAKSTNKKFEIYLDE